MSAAPGRHPCGARGRTGTPCALPAGWGTQHVGYGACKLHAGCVPSHQVAAAREEARLLMGSPIEVDPTAALVACIAFAAGHVKYASDKLAEIPESQAFEQTIAGAVLNPWARLQAEALDRLARFSKLALDAKVDQYLVRQAEASADMFATVLGGIFDDMLLDDDQRDALPEIVRRHLLAFENGDPRPIVDARPTTTTGRLI